MEGNDLTAAVLREIRDGVSMLSKRFDALDESVNARFDAVDRRFDAVDQRFDAVDQRFDTVEHALKDLAGQQVMLTRYVKHSIDRHDRDIDQLDDRVTKLETKLDS